MASLCLVGIKWAMSLSMMGVGSVAQHDDVKLFLV